ncbi:MAG TPA: hypothetical protein VEZ40_17945 [Pyrinomonadaceae bacterium]|nr:hypothetical protein [Pyrinomonadaceae bacterium]
MKALLKKRVEKSGGELTPAEIRGALLQPGRKKISERPARPAIEALNRIMCDAIAASHLLARRTKQTRSLT